MKMKYIIIPTIVFNLVCLSIFISRQYKKYHTRKSNYIHYIETIKAKIIKEIENTPFYTSTDPEINISAKNILVFHFSMEACQPCLEEISETIKSEFPNYTKNKYIIFFSNDIENRLRKNFFRETNNYFIKKRKNSTKQIYYSIIVYNRFKQYCAKYFHSRQRRHRVIEKLFKKNKEQLFQ